MNALHIHVNYIGILLLSVVSRKRAERRNIQYARKVCAYFNNRCSELQDIPESAKKADEVRPDLHRLNAKIEDLAKSFVSKYGEEP